MPKIYLYKKMHRHCFRFLLRYDSNTQEEFKTSIMGNVKVANGVLRTPKIMPVRHMYNKQPKR